jgi:hypothetical protein
MFDNSSAAPTNGIRRVAARDLLSMRWGLIPSWWKKTAKEVPSTFNARAETVANKPMLRAALQAWPLPDSGERLLRMDADAQRQTALLHQRGGWLRALDGRAMGPMDRY